MKNIKEGKFIRILLLIWVIFQLYFTTIGSIDAISLRAFHALFLLFFSLLLYPIGGKAGAEKEKASRSGILELINWIFIALALISFLYMIINYHKIAISGGYLTAIDKLIAGIGILVVFEAGRRTNKNLAILALVFLSYLFWGPLVPGSLGTAKFSVSRVLSHMFWGSQGIFGIGLGVSATYIFLFVVFGSFLKYSGFSTLINDISLALVGKSPGGPAKVAVIASALMGMMNGSAIANVATTGTITIPLMKKTGYSKEFSAAVEAAASTGGQFCPPIMGAVAFVMAEYLGVSYTKVMMAAIIPAFLYYFGIMVSVHLEAKKLGLSGISSENIPKTLEVLKERGHLIIPLIVLLLMMFMGFTPVLAAVCATFSTIISANLKKETGMGIDKIVLAATEGARSALGVGVACILIGIIIGTVSLSGLGLNFGNMIVRLAGSNNLYLVGFFVMLMSVILGMGVPGVAAYVIVVSVAVPVLISAGASPMAAHMFCLIYACLSNITPPVAMSSYVASGIAGSNMTKSSMIAVKIAISGFIIPFFFLKSPILLLDGIGAYSSLQIIRVVATSIIGVFCLAVAGEGILFEKMGILERLLLIFAGISTIDTGLATDLYGLIALVIVLALQIFRYKGKNREIKI